MNIKDYIDQRPSEFLTNLFSFVWGIWVINPLTKAFSNVSVFMLMERLAPEWVWGATFLVVGTMGFISMIFFDTIIRKFVAVLQVFLFITLGIMTAISNFQSPATPIYLTIAFCGLLSHNSILIEEKRRISYGNVIR